MNKQVMIGVGVGLLLLAVLIFAFSHKSSGNDMDMRAEMNKPRPDGPTFAPDVPVQTGGRNGKGRDTNAAPTANPNNSSTQ